VAGAEKFNTLMPSNIGQPLKQQPLPLPAVEQGPCFTAKIIGYPSNIERYSYLFSYNHHQPTTAAGHHTNTIDAIKRSVPSQVSSRQDPHAIPLSLQLLAFDIEFSRRVSDE
jgi:hypothetical protein